MLLLPQEQHTLLPVSVFSPGPTICAASVNPLLQNTVDKWQPYSPAPRLSTPALWSLMGGGGEHNRPSLPQKDSKHCHAALLLSDLAPGTDSMTDNSPSLSILPCPSVTHLSSSSCPHPPLVRPAVSQLKVQEKHSASVLLCVLTHS